MVKRKVSNPLALAVLAVLSERPMHPYGMATTLKSRAKERSIKLNYGSLYSVVDALARVSFIGPVETSRSGRRPERTTYALTADGRAELNDWLREILRTPNDEFPELEAGLSLMPALPPDVVVAALKERERRLVEKADNVQGFMDAQVAEGHRRLFVIESDYECALLRAELAWLREFIKAMVDGSFADLEDWRNWHAQVARRRAAAGLTAGWGTAFTS
jgi:DNA-binding PadR family transcriptional regulator